MALQSYLTFFRKLTVFSVMEYRRQYSRQFKWNKDHPFEENLIISITNLCFPLQLKNAEISSFAVLHIKPPPSQDGKISTGDFQISCRLPRRKTLKFPHRSIQNSSSDKIKSVLIIIPCVSLKMGSYLHPLISFSHRHQKKL